MFRNFRRHLTYANVMSTFAVFVVLGGGAYAASKLPKDSVKSKQIKAGAVKSAELADNAVTSPKVADGSLKGADFAAGQLPTGPQGATGPKGEPGPQGLQGAQGLPGQDATNSIAYVSADGNLIYGDGATVATRIGQGHYRVSFSRDLTNCVAFANNGLGNPNGNFGSGGGTTYANAYDIAADNSVEVFTILNTGPLADTSFFVAVLC